jgi:uncharacterized protein YecT (DUF1311 family)
MVSFLRVCFAIGLLGAFGSVARAQGDDGCAEARTQVDMNACAAIAFRRVDGELNRRYADYRAQLVPDQRRQLRDAQAAWVRYRDLVCRFESSGVEGGSLQPFILNQCLAARTKARLGEIEALAACEEGDLSCPAASPKP